jgi:hypothetical protein
VKLRVAVLMLTVALTMGAPAAAADKPAPKGVQQLWEAYPLRPKTPPAPARPRAVRVKTTRPGQTLSPQAAIAASRTYSDSSRRSTLALAAVAATGVLLLLLVLLGHAACRPPHVGYQRNQPIKIFGPGLRDEQGGSTASRRPEVDTVTAFCENFT